jgi:hypothetical protein
VSGGVPSSTTFHADADRALVGFEGCAYFEVHVVGLDGTGAPRLRRDCPIRRHRVARVRGRDALVRVACRHGCVLSVLGSAEAHALPGRTATLRVRLSDRRRRRLRATGAVDLSLLVHVRRPLREERVQRIRVSVRR